MNVLDLVLLAALVMALVGGFRAGLIARAASWLGIIAGFFVAIRTTPWVVGLLDTDDSVTLLMVSLGTIALTVTIVGLVFSMVGAMVRRTIAATTLSLPDRLFGAAASVVVLVAAIWLLVPAAANVPGLVAQQVRASTLVATLTDFTPRPPDATRILRQLVGGTRFPEVFADFGASPDVGPLPDDVDVDEGTIRVATRSTAHVRASGCGRGYDGSSFVIGDDLMMTNAHVVAGAEAVRVRFPDGDERDAVVVVFDPERDLALLHVEELNRPALSLEQPQTGSTAVVIGYPGGQLEPRVAASRIEAERSAIGRDIYGREPVTRDVLFLAAALRQGDSGSPVIGTSGAVNGVVFAISPDNAGAAYALTLDEASAVLTQPHDPGYTGTCM